MTNPTTPFSWQMPTATDLVTDLPADFEVFGQAVATSMADLLGGTTGQILAKASNTNMDFTWITNDVGDITAVTAGTGITGGGTSGAVTVSFDEANYGGGQFAAGKNKHLNSDFGIWQRGTSFAAAANNAYTADRWQVQTSGTGITVSQQTFTPGTAPVSGYEGTYFLRLANDGTSATCRIGQPIEDVRIFAGQTVTLSFWAKSSITDAFTTSYILQGFGSGGSAQVATSLGTMPTVTSSWARYSITVAVPSVSGKTIGTGSSVTFQMRFKASASYTIDLWGVQVEAGSVATPFQTATGTVQGELAACQRYFWRNTATGDPYTPFNYGVATSTARSDHYFQFPVTMRTRPTSAGGSNLTLGDLIGGNFPITSLTMNTNNAQGAFLYSGGATGMTQFRAMALFANNSTSAYVEFSAEL